MARTNTIQWRKADKDKLARMVQRFNAKISRVGKRNPALAALQPERANSPELQELLKKLPRKEYNRVINKMGRYLRQGAELPYTTSKGVNTTLYEKKEIDIAFHTINQRRKEQMKKFDISPYRGTMGTVEQNNLKPRKNTVQAIEPKNWSDFVRNLERQLIGDSHKKEQYKDNFLKAIEANLGKGELYDRVKNLDVNLLEKSLYENPIFTLSFTYDPIEAEEKEVRMMEELDAILSDKDNFAHD